MNSPANYREKLLELYKRRGMSEEAANEHIAKLVALYMLQNYSPEEKCSPEKTEEALAHAWREEEARKKREETSRLAAVDIDSAADFIDAISPRGSYFHISEPGEWLFRGQSNDAWPMRPTALRPALLPDPYSHGLSWGVSNPDSSTNDEQVIKELVALREFYWRADRSGLAIPGDTLELRQIFTGRDHHEMFSSVTGGKEDYDWPQPRFIALMAFAQHHGLPTRLLDWTRNVYVAAYFAAREAASWHMASKKEATHLSVWAFKRSHAFESFDRFFRRNRGEPQDHDDIVEHSAPGATNRNLHAQEGLFLVHRRRLVGKNKVQTTPFEDLISDYINKTQSAAERRFYKFRLKISEAPKLLYELHRLGIDYASLFPGGDGVTKSLMERAWWAK